MLKYVIEYISSPKAWTTEVDVGIVNSTTFKEARALVEKAYAKYEIKNLTIDFWNGPDVFPLAPDSVDGLV